MASDAGKDSTEDEAKVVSGAETGECVVFPLRRPIIDSAQDALGRRDDGGGCQTHDAVKDIDGDGVARKARREAKDCKYEKAGEHDGSTAEHICNFAKEEQEGTRSQTVPC